MKTGLVLGCFDLLHAGHFDHFRLAKAHCDKLIVGVAHDKLVRAFKGPGRPIFPVCQRVFMISQNQHVDEAVIYGDRNSARETNVAAQIALVESVKPDIFCEGEDRKGEVLKGYLEEKGIERLTFPRLSPGTISTTYFIEKIKGKQPDSAVVRDVEPYYFPW